MTSLFAIFDASSLMGLPLNWISSFIVIIFIVPCFWLSKSFNLQLWSATVKTIKMEFLSVVQPFSLSSTVFISISLLITIILNNCFGLFPYTFTSSSHLTFTLSMAFPLWLGHMVFASSKTPNYVFSHLVPLGSPSALMPFMVLIELISSVIRPLTLSVRLGANMIAGHLLLSLMGSNGEPKFSFVAGFILLGLVLLCVLECAVSLIQAYVFSVLSTLYINEVNLPQSS